MNAEQQDFDVVVLGSGAAGLAAAVTASALGLKVIVLERAPVFGGTSAISGGAVWIPGSDEAKAAGLDASLDMARQFLVNMLGDRADRDLIDAFLSGGPEALRFLQAQSDLKFTVRPVSPDYHQEVPGASNAGRTLEIVEFDGRALGEPFKDLRRPPEGMLVFGGMMVSRVDIQHLLSAKRSLRSAWHSLKLVTRYLGDRLSHPRGTRLTVGNALIARLASTLFQRKVPIWLEVEVTGLVQESGRVVGVELRHAGKEMRLKAARGVLLATGGYAGGAASVVDRPDTGPDHLSMSQPTTDGMAQRLAMQGGAALGEGLISNFFWAPVSSRRHADGHVEQFPHLVTDRAKPGVIAVDACGRRFTNEADSYHRFVLAMQALPQASRRVHLICDAAAMDAYGMGLARPSPSDRTPLIRDGYLKRADSLAKLAAIVGIEPDALVDTVERFNQSASKGIDPDFRRGESSYNKSMGDPHRAHANLAPLVRGPFYAIELHTGDLGSARGIVGNGNGQAVDTTGAPIPGLFVAGNEMNSVMAGAYPGPGITLGPALTFGYLAAKTMSGQS